MRVYVHTILFYLVLGVVIFAASCKATRTITTTAKAVPAVQDTMLIETQVVETYDGVIRR